jgi:hypothetical protein
MKGVEMDISEIKEGSVLRLIWVKGYGGHGATMKITKVNNKSFKAVEMNRSYSPGTLWTIHKNSEFLVLSGENKFKFNRGELEYSGKNEYFGLGDWQ